MGFLGVKPCLASQLGVPVTVTRDMPVIGMTDGYARSIQMFQSCAIGEGERSTDCGKKLHDHMGWHGTGGLAHRLNTYYKPRGRSVADAWLNPGQDNTIARSMPWRRLPGGTTRPYAPRRVLFPAGRQICRVLTGRCYTRHGIF